MRCEAVICQWRENTSGDRGSAFLKLISQRFQCVVIGWGKHLWGQRIGTHRCTRQPGWKARGRKNTSGDRGSGPVCHQGQLKYNRLSEKAPLVSEGRNTQRAVNPHWRHAVGKNTSGDRGSGLVEISMRRCVNHDVGKSASAGRGSGRVGSRNHDH